MEGYAAKFYFAPREATHQYEQQPWYFEGVTVEDAEDLLGDPLNPEGSFLVRKSQDRICLSLKIFGDRETQDQQAEFKFEHYEINSDEEHYWFNSQNKFNDITNLIKSCMENEQEGFATKLTNICLLPSPHSNPDFEFYNSNYDSLEVPISEIELGSVSGMGYGDVYKAKFRGTVDVAAKQLKTDNLSESESEGVLEEFFKEINMMKGLNHPNLIHLFGFITGTREGNFIIQEFMAEGDLKNYLQKLKKQPQRLKAETRLWSKLLSWNLEVARGMERLESLNIVHRDLAARYLITKFPLRK